MTSQNAREIILTWIRERLKDSPAFTLPEVTDEILETFGEDHQLISALLRTHLRGVVYELVQKVAAEGRSLVVHGVHIDPTRADEAHQKLRDDFWGRVYENIRGQQKPLLDLTYDDLKEMERNRLEKAEEHTRWARFARILRNKMKKGQSVRDRFTEEEVEALWRRALEGADSSAA